MQIAVSTPTGTVGRHVVAGLIRAGVRPRVIVRDPGRLHEEVRANVDVVVADLFDAEQVAAATVGVDALHWVTPSSAGEDPLADHARAAAALTGAVRAHGIARVVFQSSVGAELRHGAGEIDGLAATEVALETTGASVTHLRCGYFFSNLLLDPESLRTGVVRIVLPPEQPMSWVAPRDIADVAIGRLLNADWSGRVVQAVHGPVDLSWAQAAQIVTEVTGAPVTVERVSDADLRAGMLAAGMSGKFADAVLGMSRGLREGFVPEQPRTIATTTPTTLAAWSYENLRPVLSR